MTNRLARIACGLLAITCLLAAPAWATETFLGRIQTVSNGVVTIQTQGKGLSFAIAPDATIIRNARRVKLEDLKQNDQATVTTDNRMAALVIQVR